MFMSASAHPSHLPFHAETEGVSRRINVNLEERVLLFNWIGKYSGAECGRTRRGCPQIGHGEIEMNLLWLPIRPLGGNEVRHILKGQLQWQLGDANLAPQRVARVNDSSEQFPVEGGQSSGIWAVKDEGSQLDGWHVRRRHDTQSIGRIARSGTGVGWWCETTKSTSLGSALRPCCGCRWPTQI
jgi:hypothetical protein